ncbi:hypothetical protein BKM16_19540 [Pseudomonas amygdali pv. morsprunorum]|uniref:Uncharacterized protein n=1 Tax=Pseudomonas syringae TaxID=317 RepID=A0A2K4X2E9_PSESX|nr:hypothetical protein BKM19_002045 [Pseudomonas amygdali pv. morsprunorum]SOS42312.1 hypothetical protein CFBP3840_05307 [Pseudomonas syringae]KWS49051.1 hypothetical protein AL056_17240 [Pseudomonas amygdali pv. morsprunorum]KWS58845.1 hypothetical protein AL054_11735 [Pseudomonas amygdali pv. morsprunorum]PHX34565.1 hypothetical protein AO282_20035 [Pseudomonas amygdali pv. morsprunorum]
MDFEGIQMKDSLNKTAEKFVPSAVPDAFETRDLLVTFLNAPILCNEDQVGALVTQDFIKDCSMWVRVYMISNR